MSCDNCNCAPKRTDWHAEQEAFRASIKACREYDAHMDELEGTYNIMRDALRDIATGYEWSGNDCRERAEQALRKEQQ